MFSDAEPLLTWVDGLSVFVVVVVFQMGLPSSPVDSGVSQTRISVSSERQAGRPTDKTDRQVWAPKSAPVRVCGVLQVSIQHVSKASSVHLCLPLSIRLDAVKTQRPLARDRL